MYRELLHPDDAIVVISNRLLNGDVVLMVHEHCAMHAVYVCSTSTSIDILDYAKVSKRSQRDERRPSQDGMTMGHQHQENRQ
jgi:hypothetical protein